MSGALGDAPAAEDPFAPEELEARARRRLTLDPPAGLFDPSHHVAHGDHRLSGLPPDMPPTAHRPAAVLVPLVSRPAGVTMLLTQRAAHLRHHSGQIAFPGGRIDAEDASPIAAALREAREEIGLDAALVRPLGFLDAYLTGTGYRVLPLVAMVSPAHELRLNAAEVDLAFEVPLSFLMTPANHQRHARKWQGTLRSFYAMPFADHYIWGATAGIIRNMYERLYAT